MVKTRLFVLVLLLFVISSLSFGAMDAYLELDGVPGNGSGPGREDLIKVIGSSHEVFAPRDAASGLPTGVRQHEPFRIIKEVDIASPILYQALTDNWTFQTWELKFWQEIPVSPYEQQYYTVRLFDAKIVGIRYEALNNQYAEYASRLWLYHQRQRSLFQQTN